MDIRETKNKLKVGSSLCIDCEDSEWKGLHKR